MFNKIRIIVLIVGWVFVVSGLVIAVPGLVFIIFADKVEAVDDNGEIIPAVISDMILMSRTKDSASYRVMIVYTYNGQTFERPLSWYSSRMYKGQEIEIKIDPANPGTISYPRELDSRAVGKLVGFVMLFMGLLVVLAGVVIIFIPGMQKRRNKRLLRTGARIKAEISRVYQNSFFTVNGHQPWLIECSWRAPDGTVYVFRSQNFWEYPGSLLDAKNITSLPVYYDPANIKRYVVDVSVLKQYTRGKTVSL